MNLYFTTRGRPIPITIHTATMSRPPTSFETDELLHHTASPATERMAKLLVDHALAYGWGRGEWRLLPAWHHLRQA